MGKLYGVVTVSPQGVASVIPWLVGTDPDNALEAAADRYHHVDTSMGYTHHAAIVEENPSAHRPSNKYREVERYTLADLFDDPPAPSPEPGKGEG
jgi:hypothetical protein